MFEVGENWVCVCSHEKRKYGNLVSSQRNTKQNKVYKLKKNFFFQLFGKLFWFKIKEYCKIKKLIIMLALTIYAWKKQQSSSVNVNIIIIIIIIILIELFLYFVVQL